MRQTNCVCFLCHVVRFCFSLQEPADCNHGDHCHHSNRRSTYRAVVGFDCNFQDLPGGQHNGKTVEQMETLCNANSKCPLHQTAAVSARTKILVVFFHSACNTVPRTSCVQVETVSLFLTRVRCCPLACRHRLQLPARNHEVRVQRLGSIYRQHFLLQARPRAPKHPSASSASNIFLVRPPPPHTP